MEELQDAIEDAQYVNAISNVDEGPRPVVPWEKPTEEELAEWKEKVKRMDKENPGEYEALSLEWIMSDALGFFLFSAFLKETCKEYVQINLIEEVIRWRSSRARQKSDKARKIVSSYFMPRPKDEETGEMNLPSKTEIDEYDLLRPPVTLPLSKEDIKILVEENFDSSCSKCCIGLDGPIRDEIVARVVPQKNTPKSAIPPPKSNDNNVHGDNASEESGTKKLEEEKSAEKPAIDMADGNETSLSEMLPEDDASSAPKPKSLQHLPEDFFDKAELVVVNMLKAKYFDAFLQSMEYAKFIKFLWIQDGTVVEEDFYVMRVLGRGGFGLVTGEFQVIPNMSTNEITFFAVYKLNDISLKGISPPLFSFKHFWF